MKHIIRSAAVSSVALGLAATMSAPAGAAPTTIYRGTFGGETDYQPVGCSTVKTVEGAWAVRVVGSRAIVTVNLFYDGEHHLAYGGLAAGAFELQTPGDDVFVLQSDTGGSGTTITMTLSDEGELSYVVAPYRLYGADCTSLELTGSLS